MTLEALTDEERAELELAGDVENYPIPKLLSICAPAGASVTLEALTDEERAELELAGDVENYPIPKLLSICDAQAKRIAELDEMSALLTVTASERIALVLRDLQAARTELGRLKKPKGALPWRSGRRIGRTIYDAHDALIGTMDATELTTLVVEAVNAVAALQLSTPDCDHAGSEITIDRATGEEWCNDCGRPNRLDEAVAKAHEKAATGEHWKREQLQRDLAAAKARIAYLENERALDEKDLSKKAKALDAAEARLAEATALLSEVAGGAPARLEVMWYQRCRAFLANQPAAPEQPTCADCKGPLSVMPDGFGEAYTCPRCDPPAPAKEEP